MRVLVTGAAGFIGFHLSRRLLARGDQVVGVDNLTPYYDPRLKQARLGLLAGTPGFLFARLDLSEASSTDELLRLGPFDASIHLAAQAGVRYSREAPRSYEASNLAGWLNVLEACRAMAPHHVVFASSSSVYGEAAAYPVAEDAETRKPVSLYAATKMAGELLGYSYADQYGVAVTALRLFTVYGPWGRPDMAIFKFTEAILSGRPVELYDGGRGLRDFTFVDDTVAGILGALGAPPREGEPRFRAYNLGRGEPVSVLQLLDELERQLGRRAVRRTLPPQPGDVGVTFADIAAARADLGYQPRTPLAEGLAAFVAWRREHYGDDRPLERAA